MLDKIKTWLDSRNVDLADAGVRAAKTFVSAALATGLTLSQVTAGDTAAISAASIAGGSAVITFAWNVLLDWTRAPKRER